MTLVQHYSFAIWKKIILFLMITVFECHNAFMALIPVRNNQFCHLMYWCNLFLKRGWKSDLYIEIQLSGFHETAVIFLWAKTCSTVDRRKINSHHVLKSTTICPKQQSHSERGKKSDIKLNVRWIMHVRGKTRLYRYLSDWLVLWQWGSISAPSLTLHSLLLSDDL